MASTPSAIAFGWALSNTLADAIEMRAGAHFRRAANNDLALHKQVQYVDGGANKAKPTPPGRPATSIADGGAGARQDPTRDAPRPQRSEAKPIGLFVRSKTASVHRERDSVNPFTSPAFPVGMHSVRSPRPARTFGSRIPRTQLISATNTSPWPNVARITKADQLL